jgi:signal transduction histidine kinase
LAVPNAGSSEELHEVVARLRAEIDELRASRTRLAEAAHAERRSIERELHDGVQQHLVALGVGLQRLRALIDRDPGAANALLTEMTANVREAQDEATKLATRTYPPMLEGRAFASALRSAADRAGVTAVIDVPAPAAYPPEVSTALYWTWLEVLSPASPGSEATIRVLDADGGLAFEVTIAGRLPEGRLEGLRDRVEALGGRLTVDDRQDNGARLQGWLPLPR